MPIDRKKGEREEEYISRCIATEVSAGKPTEQAVAICYNKSRMSKEKSQHTLEERVMSKIKQINHIQRMEITIDSTYPGEKAEELITPNPCQSGYIAIGTKIKNGREVPNCVPKE